MINLDVINILKLRELFIMKEKKTICLGRVLQRVCFRTSELSG